jgi:hypothetical protein
MMVTSVNQEKNTKEEGNGKKQKNMKRRVMIVGANHTE